MTSVPVRYTLCPAHPAAHRFTVSCAVAAPDPAGQRFALPAWIPGSYMIRDFARHIVAIHAEAGGKTVRLDKLDKHTWRAAPVGKGLALTVSCEIYAWDLSVRGAHLDPTHAFFNGANVFLRVLGQESQPCLVDLRRPEGKDFAAWRVATSLPAAAGERACAREHGFGLYRAENYDELIDHPVEMGQFTRIAFEACGVPHEIAITGRHDADPERLAADLKRVCEWQIRFFGEPPPMARYVFLVTVVDEAYGGLEHRASTALLCARKDLPYRGMKGLPEAYRTFLGLCSHEYFHAWNVKRIKPAAFAPYDLDRENYTTQLWAFEGITSYYDDLALLRSGVIALRDWLDLTARTIGRVMRAPGRLRQSLAESSFDAWSKFYRPDENTPNAVVNYYAKGALAALALDLTLRRETRNRSSLDEVMRALWRRFGQTGNGVGDDDLQGIAEESSGLDLRRFFAQTIHGTRDIPLGRLLAPFGIRLAWEKARTPALGVKTGNKGGEIRLATVYDDGPAQRAGLSAGDTLVAIDGLRVTAQSLDTLLSRRRPGDVLAIHAFRRDELMRFDLTLGAYEDETPKLLLAKSANALRRAWLGG
ncbi:MAG: PDZ domain-containing protein [Candidatus Accumulibacter sp.]|jgi:predicted metalloprotease with PDZ domain|nr:PDZ domain-containing protein [Accumulibacter sp.]